MLLKTSTKYEVTFEKNQAYLLRRSSPRAIGVKTKTLQNGEQNRVRSTGPARVLLRIVERNPKALEELRETA